MSGHGKPYPAGVASIADPVVGGSGADGEGFASVVISGPVQAVKAFMDSGVVASNGLTAVPSAFYRIVDTGYPPDHGKAGLPVIAVAAHAPPTETAAIAAIEQSTTREIDARLGVLEAALRSASDTATAAAETTERRGDDIDAMLSRIAQTLRRGAAAS